MPPEENSPPRRGQREAKRQGDQLHPGVPALAGVEEPGGAAQVGVVRVAEGEGCVWRQRPRQGKAALPVATGQWPVGGADGDAGDGLARGVGDEPPEGQAPGEVAPGIDGGGVGLNGRRLGAGLGQGVGGQGQEGRHHHGAGEVTGCHDGCLDAPCLSFQPSTGLWCRTDCALRPLKPGESRSGQFTELSIHGAVKIPGYNGGSPTTSHRRARR